MSIKKAIAVLISFSLIMAIMVPTAGAFTKKPAGTFKPDISKPVKLTMWITGEAPPDTEKVYGEVNKILKKKINATVETKWTTWTDFLTKYQLLFASGEDFDATASYNWMGFNDLALKNGYWEITNDRLQKFAPGVVKTYKKEWLDESRIKGKLFMIPAAGANKSNMKVVEIRGDLRQKYKIPPLKTMADFENYLITVAKNEKRLIALNMTVEDVARNFLDMTISDRMAPIGPPNLFYTNMSDKTGKIVPFYEVPEYKAFLQRMRKLYEAGAIPKNVLSNKLASGEAFKVGRSAASINSIGDCYGKVEAMNQEHPSWKGEVFDIMPANAKLPALSHGTDGLSVYGGSRNPERTLMMIDLFCTDKEVNRLTTYGIQGKSYELVGTNKYKQIGDAKNFNASTSCAWAWVNSSLGLVSATRPQSYSDMVAKQDRIATYYPLLGFNFDDSEVRTEFASVTNVLKTYFSALEVGAVDPGANLDKSIKKIKEAGMDKLVAKINAQAKEYLKNKK